MKRWFSALCLLLAGCASGYLAPAGILASFLFGSGILLLYGALGYAVGRWFEGWNIGTSAALLWVPLQKRP